VLPPRPTSKSRMMRIVVALGGNALLRRDESPTAENQARNLALATAALAPLFAAGHQIILTHGNGPQVGHLAARAERLQEEPAPLDVLDAETAGMIGYSLAQSLRNAIGAGSEIVTVLSEVVVDGHDPAFEHPVKPIGQVYSDAEMTAVTARHPWVMAKESKGWRRVVPSPMPIEILGLGGIRLLVEHGRVVICLGGGGIPVIRDAKGQMRGIEAVIDKDLASSLLARELNADWLLMLTDVDAVYADWGTSQACALRNISVPELANHRFEAGSMGPKIAAAEAFVLATRGKAGIGRLQDAAGILEGRAGSRILPT
jgi:carbamate kinase